jgi:hypothetical protein
MYKVQKKSIRFISPEWNVRISRYVTTQDYGVKFVVTTCELRQQRSYNYVIVRWRIKYIYIRQRERR